MRLHNKKAPTCAGSVAGKFSLLIHVIAFLALHDKLHLEKLTSSDKQQLQLLDIGKKEIMQIT